MRTSALDDIAAEPLPGLRPDGSPARLVVRVGTRRRHLLERGEPRVDAAHLRCACDDPTRQPLFGLHRLRAPQRAA